jgi:hypothetical protein
MPAGMMGVCLISLIPESKVGNPLAKHHKLSNEDQLGLQHSAFLSGALA